MATRKAVRSLVALASGASLGLLGFVATPQLAGAAALAPSQVTPSEISVSVGDQQLTVSWSVPAGDPSQQITATATGDTTKACTATIGDQSCTITGLTNGTSYAVNVSSGDQGTINEGSSTPSAPSSAPSEPITPPTIPVDPVPPIPVDPPPNLSTSLGVIVGDQQLTITWDARATDPSTSITATATGDVTQSCTAPAGDGSCTITRLTDGEAYGVSVAIPNGSPTTVDEGSWTPSAPFTDLSGTQPATFDSVSVAPGDQQLVVSWDPSTGEGSETITATATGAVTQSCTALLPEGSCTISGLTDANSYDVMVAITAGDPATTTSIDEGSWTPQTADTGPPITNGSATAGDGSIAVTFDPAVDPSTWITVTATNVNNSSDSSAIDIIDGAGPAGCVAADAAGCAVGGLTDGQTYDVTVQAFGSGGDVIDLGNLTPSAPAGATAPDSPTSVTVNARVSNWASTPDVFVSWSQAANDGGSVVEGYDVAVTSADGTTQANCTTTSVDATTCFLSDGLRYATAYTLKVTETNGVGTSSPATTTFTTPDAPSYDTTVSADSTGTGFLVSFTQPSADWDFTPGAFSISDANGDNCLAIANGAGNVDSCVLATPDGQAPTGITVVPADACRYPAPIPIDSPPVVIDWGLTAGANPLTLAKASLGGASRASGSPTSPFDHASVARSTTSIVTEADATSGSLDHPQTSPNTEAPPSAALAGPATSASASRLLAADHPVGAPGTRGVWWFIAGILGGILLAIRGAAALLRRA